MAKKKTKKPVKKVSKAAQNGLVKPRSAFIKSLPKNEIELVELFIWHTERAMVSESGFVDKGMVAQKERLELRLKALKSA